jgi:hypothetical protein
LSTWQKWQVRAASPHSLVQCPVVEMDRSPYPANLAACRANPPWPK